ncbi:signal recognition particle 19 kDa protein-like [Oppia nitens]|uniref:signal recognition particle 19 kDa protein-like n=1 Tax=Oppia nitens TaxID=1686743 RepID=UPI0023DABDD4|nr:signal recognition particle 19 kDa protein-like [Oppia nitens]
MTNKEVVASDDGVANKWYIIYPQYINTNLSLYKGRRLAKTECVTDPKSTEIKDVLESLNCFQVVCDLNKVYSREVDKELIQNRGYVKYALIRNKQTEEVIVGNKFDDKKKVLEYVAKMIPKLKTRTKVNTQQSGSQQSQQSQSQTNKKNKKKK